MVHTIALARVSCLFPSFNSHNSIVKEATEPTHFTDEDADWVLGKIHLLEVQRSKVNQGEINGNGTQSPRSVTSCLSWTSMKPS